MNAFLFSDDPAPTWIGFPNHKCGLHLCHNEHKNYYQSVESFVEEGDFIFESDEAKQLCINSDEIWTLQWYPDTPVGSYTVAAPSFYRVLELSNKVERENS